MNLIAGQRCPVPHCGGLILADGGYHDFRLVCTLCGLQQDRYTGNPIPIPSTKRSAQTHKPFHRGGDYQPWRRREKDAWEREIGKGE